MIVLLVGQPGIGKTRLAKFLQQHGFDFRPARDWQAMTLVGRLDYAMQELGQWYRQDADTDIVYDGFPYPNALLHGDSILEGHDQETWELRFNDVGVVYVIMLTPEQSKHQDAITQVAEATPSQVDEAAGTTAEQAVPVDPYVALAEQTWVPALTIVIDDTVNEPVARAVIEFCGYAKQVAALGKPGPR